MNYLAHADLSFPDSLSILGNLMGDFRKYIRNADLPDRVMLGIENHCRVDRFTDNHPGIINLKKLFSRHRRRYAGIIIDISFDYFLSKHWHKFNDGARDIFIGYVYDCLDHCRALMPSQMQRVMHYMIEEDWMGSYARMSGIETSLDRISYRIRFENNMRGAIEEVESNYEELENRFLEFYPQLNKYIVDLNSGT